MSNFGSQLLHVVAVALLAEFPEAAEVLADLGSSNIHFLPQGVGGNPYNTTGTELSELAVISGKTPNDSI